MLFLYDIGLGAKCPGSEMSWVRNVFSTKRPEGETSRLGAKRHSGETSVILDIMLYYASVCMPSYCDKICNMYMSF